MKRARAFESSPSLFLVDTPSAAFGVAKLHVVGRYILSGAIGSGGYATVHLGRLISKAGFSRTVAVKRLLSEYSEDPEVVAMFLDEARLVARIHHPNVVQTFDVISSDNDGRRELFMVMEYVAGETLSRLVGKYASRPEKPPLRVVLAIACDMLRGLHAAHHSKSVTGDPLGIVHCDVSPQNVIVGVHGTGRLLDFGIAKAAGRQHAMRQGDFKGKANYMAPEQIMGGATKLSDVYAASVVLWEAITAKRLFKGENQAEVLHKVVASEVPRPSTIVPGLRPAIDEIVMRGLSRDPAKRFPSAEAMAEAIEQASATARPSEVGAWVRYLAHDELQARAAQVALIEGLDASELVPSSASAPTRRAPVEPVARVERDIPQRSVVRARSRPPGLIAMAALGFLATAVLLAGAFALFGLRLTGARTDRRVSATPTFVGTPPPARSVSLAAPPPPAEAVLRRAPEREPAPFSSSSSRPPSVVTTNRETRATPSSRIR